MWKNIFSVCLCVFICVSSVQCQLEEEAECLSQSDGLKGKCVNLRRCLSSVNDIRARTYPQICSFQGRNPIICCTDCELVNDTSNYLVDSSGFYYLKTGQKAVDKCLENAISLNYSCAIKQGLERELEYTEGKCYIYAKHSIAAAEGGHDARRGEFPHMALLGYGESVASAQWLCGGSVISDRYILTAAHCLSSNAVGTVKYVALGILKRTDPPETWQQYTVQRAIRHPGYKPPSKYNDIALLEVGSRIKFNKDVLPACVYAGGSDYTYAVGTGWGALGHGKELADTLQVIDLEQFSAEECAAAYPPHRHLVNGYDHNSQSCFGDKKNKIIDTCEGDSGGPLQVTSKHGSCVYQIVGVTSYGRPCGFVGGMGVYTRVSHFVPWIESIVWP